MPGAPSSSTRTTISTGQRSPAPADGDDVGCSGPMIARAVPGPGVAVLELAVGGSLCVADRDVWATQR